MRVEERVETNVRTVYIAFDDTTFDDQHECHIYELKTLQKQAGNVVYLVRHKCANFTHIEVFSTMDLAEKSLCNVEDRTKWVIEEVVIDWRFML